MHVELQTCKFKTNGSIEERIDATVIVKSCKPASLKQIAIKDVSICNRGYATVIKKRERKKKETSNNNSFNLILIFETAIKDLRVFAPLLD